MIQRRTTLKRGTTPLKRTPLRKVSKTRRISGDIYKRKRLRFLEARPYCEVWLKQNGFTQQQAIDSGGELRPFASLHWWTCPRSVDVHHKAGRGGSNYLDESTWMAVSRGAHVWIHEHAREAREKGFLV